jgi:hypothetical protein
MQGLLHLAENQAILETRAGQLFEPEFVQPNLARAEQVGVEQGYRPVLRLIART